MNKIITVLSILAVAGGAYIFSTMANNHNHDHGHEEEVAHYEGQQIDSKEQAVQILQDNNAKISEILKAEALSAAELENIHEISYTLEAAIDKLIAEKMGAADQLAAIDEAIQAVHHASEDHEEAKVREWFSKLEPAAGNLNTDVAN